MTEYFLPIVIIVCSNVIYNLAQKCVPAEANAFLSLGVSYIIGLVLCIILYMIGRKSGIVNELRKLNWTSLILGVAIVGLEVGYILTYRAGWNISIGSLVANIALAVLLIPIGIILFKESFSFNKVLGVFLCITGLIVMNFK